MRIARIVARGAVGVTGWVALVLAIVGCPAGGNAPPLPTPPFSIGGAITGVVGPTTIVTVTLTGVTGGSVATASPGAYGFSGLGPGAYTVTPSAPCLTFAPVTRIFSLAANQTGADFASLPIDGCLYTSPTTVETIAGSAPTTVTAYQYSGTTASHVVAQFAAGATTVPAPYRPTLSASGSDLAVTPTSLQVPAMLSFPISVSSGGAAAALRPMYAAAGPAATTVTTTVYPRCELVPDKRYLRADVGSPVTIKASAPPTLLKIDYAPSVSQDIGRDLEGGTMTPIYTTAGSEVTFQSLAATIGVDALDFACAPVAGAVFGNTGHTKSIVEADPTKQPCATGFTPCALGCVDTNTSAADCGGCGNACAGQCAAGHCTLDLTLAVITDPDPPTLFLDSGGSGQIAVIPAGTFPGQATLAFTSQAAGITGAFAANGLASWTATTLTVSAALSVPPGLYPGSISASAGIASSTVNFLIYVGCTPPHCASADLGTASLWAPSTDAAPSDQTVVTLEPVTVNAASISGHGGNGATCGCNAQHKLVPLGRTFDCASTTMVFHANPTGAPGYTNSTALDFRFCTAGSCNTAVPWYGGDGFYGSTWTGHSNCATHSSTFTFPNPAQVSVGRNVVNLGALSQDGSCTATFDTVDVHLQYYGCFTTDVAAMQIWDLTFNQ